MTSRRTPSRCRPVATVLRRSCKPPGRERVFGFRLLLRPQLPAQAGFGALPGDQRVQPRLAVADIAERLVAPRAEDERPDRWACRSSTLRASGDSGITRGSLTLLRSGGRRMHGGHRPRSPVRSSPNTSSRLAPVAISDCTPAPKGCPWPPAARQTAASSSISEHAVAAALRGRLLDVRRRVDLDQVAAGSPAEQPLDVR